MKKRVRFVVPRLGDVACGPWRMDERSMRFVEAGIRAMSPDFDLEPLRAEVDRLGSLVADEFTLREWEGLLLRAEVGLGLSYG